MGYLHDKRRKALSRLLIRHGIPTTFQLCDSRVLSGTPNKTQEIPVVDRCYGSGAGHSGGHVHLHAHAPYGPYGPASPRSVLTVPLTRSRQTLFRTKQTEILTDYSAFFTA